MPTPSMPSDTRPPSRIIGSGGPEIWLPEQAGERRKDCRLVPEPEIVRVAGAVGTGCVEQDHGLDLMVGIRQLPGSGHPASPTARMPHNAELADDYRLVVMRCPAQGWGCRRAQGLGRRG